MKHNHAVKIKHACGILICISLLFETGICVGADATAQGGMRSVSCVDHPSRVIGRYIDYIEDPEGEMTIGDILSDKNKTRWKRSRWDFPNFGFSGFSYWIRFSVENKSPENRMYILEHQFPPMDSIEHYTYDATTRVIERISAGDSLPYGLRQIRYRNALFKIACEARSAKTHYMRFATTSSMNLGLVLWTPDAFIEKVDKEQSLLGMYYGIMIVMFLYNLFIFFVVRDESYILYVCYILSYFAYQVALNGTAYLFVPERLIIWFNNSIPLFMFVASSFGILFTRSFLNTKMIKAYDRFLLVVFAMNIVGIPVTFLVSYRVGIQISTLIPFISHIIMIVTGVLFLMKGYKPAKYYTIAWILFIAGGLIQALKAYGLLPITGFTVWSQQVGSACEVTLLSFALADRIRVIKDEKDNAREEVIRIQKEAAGILETKVEQRTSELLEANKKLSELDRAKTEFFANVSHELRTPLTLIIAPIEATLKNASPRGLDDEFLSGIHRNAVRLLQLINNLLDFAKIESGRMTLRRERSDLSRLLALFVANVRSGAESRGISVAFIDTTKNPHAVVDRGLFENAIYNLLSNAIKFTGDGGSVAVTLREEKGTVLVDVSDTGIGIPADRQDDIFERFSQVDGSITRKHDGTGIGLALTREIARMHGGDVNVASDEGKGSVFTLALPKSINEQNDGSGDQTGAITAPAVNPEYSINEARWASIVGPADTLNDTQKECDRVVLLVEDNHDMLSFLADTVSADYSFTTAMNGKEALRALDTADEAPDIIVSDVMMPEMDGLELVRNIRSDARFEGIPIILLTARADTGMKLEGFDRGATDYVVKPFNASELLARMNAQLELKKLRDRLALANRKLYERLERAAGSGGLGVSATAEEKLERVMEFIAEHYTSDLSREGLAAAVGMSPDHLSRVFNRHTGKKIGDHINELRVRDAANRLASTDEDVIDIAYGVGFENLRTFNRAFQKIMGATPSGYREACKRTLFI